MPGWDYWKYGTTYAFLSNISSYREAVRKEFNNIFPGHKPVFYANGYSDVVDVILNMYKLANDVEGYYESKHLKTPVPPKKITPKEYFEIVCNAILKDQSASFDLTYMAGESFGAYYALSEFFLSDVVEKGATGAHDSKLYHAWMLATNGTSDFYNNFTTVSGIKIACPVDVEVYDIYGNLAGKITDNEIDETIEGNLTIIIEDDVKYLYFPSEQKYSIHLTGTDDGTMEYSVQLLDLHSLNNAEEKVFTDISLYKGKQMICEIDGEQAISDTELLISKKGKIIGEVLTDGSEINHNKKVLIIAIAFFAIIVIFVYIVLRIRKNKINYF